MRRTSPANLNKSLYLERILKASVFCWCFLIIIFFTAQIVFANQGSIPVTFEGNTVLEREVHIKIIDFPEKVTISNKDGYFSKTFDNIPTGVHQVILWVQDIKGNVGKKLEISTNIPEGILQFTVSDIDLSFEECRPDPDLNQDGKVNFYDFSILLFWWRPDHRNADLNCDGRVNVYDFAVLLSNWTKKLFK